MEIKVIIINGPNLNLTGTREQSVYGKKSFETLFILSDSVKIPPRPFMLPTYNNQKQTIINRFKLARTYASEGRRYIR